MIDDPRCHGGKTRTVVRAEVAPSKRHRRERGRFKIEIEEKEVVIQKANWGFFESKEGSTEQTVPVAIDLSEQEPAKPASAPESKQTSPAAANPRPRTTKPQMLEAFRRAKMRRRGASEADEVIEAIVDAQGPGSLCDALLKETDATP